MDLPQNLFVTPRLRNGVTFYQDNNKVFIEYRSQGCTLQCQNILPADINSLLSILQQGTKNTKTLKKDHLATLGDINYLLDQLDQLGLLEEAANPPVYHVRTGEDFYYAELLPMVRSLQYKLGNSPLYIRMQNKGVSRNELTGFAMEYYHLVKMAPGLIAPSISHVVDESINKQLIRLFVEEYDHDSMMIACLESVGITKNILSQRQPLASTFSVNASLGIYSRQHALSFFSALFLFETPSIEFNNLFIESCRRHHLPDTFYRPVIKHSEINEKKDHGAITEMLLKAIPVISSEEQLTTLIHIHALVEMLHKQDQDIVSYYSQPEVDLYRLFS